MVGKLSVEGPLVPGVEDTAGVVGVEDTAGVVGVEDTAGVVGEEDTAGVVGEDDEIILLVETEGCSVNVDADGVGIVSALELKALCVAETCLLLLEGCTLVVAVLFVTLIDAVVVDASAVVIRAP